MYFKTKSINFYYVSFVDAQSFQTLDEWICLHKMYLQTQQLFADNDYVKMKRPSRTLRPIGRRWSPFPKARNQTPVFTLQDHGYGASASRGVPVYVPAYAGTHCAYPRREGPGWVDLGGWLHTGMVSHPSTCLLYTSDAADE